MTKKSFGDISIKIGGDQSGQIAIGPNNNLQNTIITTNEQATVSDSTTTDVEILRQMFTALRSQLSEAAPSEKQGSALERLNELEETILSEEPDLTTMQYIKGWFAKNMPTFAGAITSLLLHPLVGSFVEAAGTIAAGEFVKKLKND